MNLITHADIKILERKVIMDHKSKINQPIFKDYPDLDIIVPKKRIRQIKK